jgi:TPR repeat protein
MIAVVMVASTSALVGRLMSPDRISSERQTERGTEQDNTSRSKATRVTPTGRDTLQETRQDTHQDSRLALEPQRDHRQIELLLARSWKLMSGGDVEAARTLLERAAKSGDPRAALALGATYDPLMLAILEARGVEPDAFLARIWYRRAIAFGSEETKKPSASAGSRPPPRQQGAHDSRQDTTARRSPNVM